MTDKKSDKFSIKTIRENIFQIPGKFPFSHIYIIKGTNKNVMIDTGVADNYSNFVEQLAEIGLSPDDIDMVILTHEHMDHAGAAIFFTDTAVIAAHRSAANKIELQDEFVTLRTVLAWRIGHFTVDFWLEEGNFIDLGNYKLRVIHTPGHTSGCMCLYEPSQKLLFSGDTVFAGGTLSQIGPSGNISDYMESIERLNALKIDELYPGHGRTSKTPEEDMSKATEYAMTLFEDSKLLFEAMATIKGKTGE